MEFARPAPRHVKKTLPPTLSGFPGEAEIRYYVKCTVGRHGFLKENARTQAPFNFFPIENPRPPITGAECFARQKHRFDGFEAPLSPSVGDKMKGMFGKKSGSTPSSPIVGSGSPFISIDARLPEPPIITCNQDLPLRLIFKKLSEFGDEVFMNSLQISLIGHTKIRAQDVFRTETNSWIICSTSNMNVLLGRPSDPVDTETVVDDRLWRGPSHVLPNTVAPNFETCNIERTYQLDIRIGLSYGDRDAKVRIGQWRRVVRLREEIFPFHHYFIHIMMMLTLALSTATTDYSPTSHGLPDLLRHSTAGRGHCANGRCESWSSTAPNI